MIDLSGRRVLIVGAHADDIEIGCGGTAHKLLQAGSEVTGLVVTDTHYVRDGVVHRDSAVAQQEGREAAKILGYETHFGSVRNNDVKVTSELVYFIRDHIERCKADTIFTHWDGDAHLVQIAPGQSSAPNLTAMLAATSPIVSCGSSSRRSIISIAGCSLSRLRPDAWRSIGVKRLPW